MLQQRAHENQMEARGQQVSFHDAHAMAHSFQAGDQVLRYRKSEAQKGVASKLMYKWDGPYFIIEQKGTRYKLKDKDGKIIPDLIPGKELYKDPGDLVPPVRSTE